MTAPSETHERRPTTEWCILQFCTNKSFTCYIVYPVYPKHIRQNNEILNSILERDRTFQCPSSVWGIIITNNLTLNHVIAYQYFY